MHDLDRTQLEMGWESGSFGYESDQEYGETQDELYGELSGATGVFNEMDELELAAQLLEVTDEAELDQFLGSLLSTASGAIGGALRSPVGNAVGGILKGVAKKALPAAGAAVGDWLAPGRGGKIGSQLATAAGNLFGLELEGLSAEDQEFEVARNFVRLAGAAVENAAQAPSNAPPAAVAQKAVAAAAQQYAPGLLKPARPMPARNGGQRRHAAAGNGREVAMSGGGGSPFSEAEEMTLAAELLEVADEAELDQFFGDVIKKAVGGLSKAASGPLGGVLKGLAKQALPMVGGALGSLIPVPGVGTAVGTAVGKALSKALEMESAGLDSEDQEYEMARNVIRVAGNAAQKVAQASPSADPQVAARNAVMAAQREVLPGAIQTGMVGPAQGAINRQEGRWERRGNRIVLHGV